MALGQLKAVHLGHHQVQNGDVVGLFLRGGGAQQLERPLARLGLGGDHSP